MSVAAPKTQAKEPIDLDVILVCRKRHDAAAEGWGETAVWPDIAEVAEHQVSRLLARGRKLSRNDIRVIVMAQAIRRLSGAPTMEAASVHLLDGDAAAIIDRLHVLATKATAAEPELPQA
jgi:hypothetical protein